VEDDEESDAVETVLVDDPDELGGVAGKG